MRSKALAIGLSLLLVSLLLGACTQAHLRPEGLRPPEPTPEEQPKSGGASISVEKMVSIDGGTTWMEQVDQYVCQNVQFQIIVNNDGDVPLSNIVISDYLPDCLEYVDGPAVEGICKTQVPYSPYYNLPGTSTPTWKCSELAPGNSVQVIYTAHVVESGMCKNQVSVEGEYDGESVIKWGSATVTGITGQPPGYGCPECVDADSVMYVGSNEDNTTWDGNSAVQVGNPGPYTELPLNQNTDCNAQWIWNHANSAGYGYPTGTQEFTTTFYIQPDYDVIAACLEISADDSAHIGLNGQEIGSHGNGTGMLDVSAISIDPSHFNAGYNELQVTVIDLFGYYTAGIWCLQLCLHENEPSISVEKMVSADGGANWVDEVEQNVCQNVQFQITVTNDGDVPLSNIVISDYLPDCLEYVDGPAVELCKTLSPPYYNLPGTNTPTWKCHSGLQPSASIDVTYTAHVVESGGCKNQVSVEGKYDGEIVTGGDSAVVIGITEQPPVLADWGDAPDPYYPTLNANSGAYHLLTGPYLGSLRDGEPDGQPDASALGDDNDGNDDEDGITGLTGVTTGQTHTITIVVGGGGGYVEAWVDWNGDEDWAHPAEQIFSTDLPNGTHTIAVAVPSNAVVGQTFARFRISIKGGLLPTGGADNGEVEDYTIRIEGGQPSVLADWGDAPDPYYPTLNANSGAYHLLTGPYLGSLRDGEPDGLPHASALGDDNDGNDDEDGVTFTYHQDTYMLDIETLVSGGGGYVQAWIDWNDDGDWQDSSEYIDIGYLADGAHVFSIDVSSFFAAILETFARFRISSQGNLSATGGADNGEVEDYELYISH